MINGLSKLNDKLKVVILVLYTAIAVIIALLLLNMKDENDYLKDYGDTPYNDQISLSIKIKENRDSTNKTKTDYEKSTYFITAFAQKGKNYSKAKYSGIRYLLIGVDENGKISFDEYSSELSMSQSNTSGISTGTSTNVSGGSLFSRKITVDGDHVHDENKIPVIIGVKVLYTIEYNEISQNEDGSRSYKYNSSSTDESTKIEGELNYKFSLSQINGLKNNFEQYEERKISSTKVQNSTDPIDLKIETTFTDEKSKEGSVKTDKITFIPLLNNPNLLGKEVDNINLQIFGKVLNDKKDKNNLFEDYIRVYTLVGKEASTETATKLAGVELDEVYDLSTIYVIGCVQCTDGTEYTFNYKVNLK